MDLRALLELHEGRVPHVYQDSLGYFTVGVGHMCDKLKGGRLPDKIIDDLLDWDIFETTQALYKALPWVVGLDPVRRAVLTDMAFNLGITGLLGFKNTLAFVAAGDYAQAATNMLKSKWAGQVKSRAVRLAEMMRSGNWPPDP